MFGFGKRKAKQDANTPSAEAGQAQISAEEARMAEINAAYALDQALLAQSQAHGVLFANMVSDQQKFTAASQASALKNAAELIGIDPDVLTSTLVQKSD